MSQESLTWSIIPMPMNSMAEYLQKYHLWNQKFQGRAVLFTCYLIISISVKSGTQKRKTVVFILGGVAPSEMRAAYELSNKTFKPSASWFSSKNDCTFTSDVYIGSSHIAMPHTQLQMFSDIWT